MRSFLKILLLLGLLAGTQGSDVASAFYEKGEFLEFFVVTLPNRMTKCYLVTPDKKEIYFPEDETHKYELREANYISSCIVRINDLDKNDQGLWSLYAETDSGKEEVHRNIVITGLDSSLEKNEQLSRREAESIENSQGDVNAESSEEKLIEVPDSSDSMVDSEPDNSSVGEQNESKSFEDLSASSKETESNEKSQEDANAESSEEKLTEVPDTSDSMAESEPDTSSVEEQNESQSSQDSSALSKETESVEKSQEDVTAESSEEKLTEVPDSSDSVANSEPDNSSVEENESKSFEDSSASSKETESNEKTQEDVNAESSEEKLTEVPDSSDSMAESEPDNSSVEEQNLSEDSTASSKETESIEDSEEGVNAESSEEKLPEVPDSSESIADSEADNSSVEEQNSSEDSTASSKETESIENSEENVNAESSQEKSTEAPDSNDSIAESEPVSSSSEEDLEEHWLSDQRFATRTGFFVDINLPRIPNTEDCAFTTPEGRTVKVDENDVQGVTPYQMSEYVSCRIVVGPMEASLIGAWTLCGSYFQNGIQHKRCQKAQIEWQNRANPDHEWETTIRNVFDHVVHFGKTLSPTVRGSGTVASCHIVTPGHEDLVVTPDSEYPNIKLIENTDAACNIAIGPITSSHLGAWTVYGTFNSVLMGYNEVRFPMNLALYDENNPYEQAYNVSTLNPNQHVVNIGNTISVEVASTGSVDACSFQMPSGTRYSQGQPMPTGVAFVLNNRVVCQISIGPITDSMLGGWTLTGKFSNRDIFTELVQPFTIIQEDPSNPIEEERTVSYLTEQNMDTDIGASHRVVIALQTFNTVQSCHIRTPEGLQYTIMEGFNIPGIEVEDGSNVACGIVVNVTEDVIGSWMLIAREIRSSELIERRQSFNIRVEESVDAFPSEVTIREGNDVQVRLATPTNLHSTCKLMGPDDEEVMFARPDEQHVDTCGYVVEAVEASHAGTWSIVYGNKIIYKALVTVNVNARLETDPLHLTWLEQSSISEPIGPEEAVYCRILTPRNNVEFDGFGRCHLDIDRVLRDQHAGVWTMIIGLPGHIQTEEHRFSVEVKGTDPKPEVSTSVWQSKPIVELTCAVTSGEAKTGCLFRDPQGEVLVASQGVRDGRYSFHVNQTSSESGEYYSCGLQITDPVISELGLWRCDLQSEEEGYFGFLTVLCPWAMLDPAVAAAVVAEPVLTAQVSTLSVTEGAPATLACSARAPLRYCYFLAPNGTVYNMYPGVSGTVEYSGAGLDAGECGLRVRGMASGDAGAWSCHAGFHDRPEQTVQLSVEVQEEMSLWSTYVRGALVVTGRVRADAPLDYCRFVRHDGLGFASHAVPPPYVDESVLSSGLCRLRTPASAQDAQPWTLVAKVHGRDGEISRTLALRWVMPTYTYSLFLWLPFILIVTFALMAVAALVPAKNRQWAAERASGLRASLRRFSLRKRPLALHDTNPAA